jgi:FecR protein
MPRPSASPATWLLSALLIAFSLPALAADDAPASAGASKVRIVRLSEIKGAVQMDRNIGRSFEPAFANMPIVENSRLRTDDGAAEVEFEDNSTVRLAPNTVVDFPQLERLPSGATTTSVHVVRGLAYVSLVKSPGTAFHLLFDRQDVVLPPGTHVRLALDDAQANLAVLNGSVKIDAPSGAVDVARRDTATFHLVDQGPPSVMNEVASEPYDSWDKDATSYHSRTAALSAFGNAPYSYGLNDMMYYGSFQDAGACGSMWRPYFASAAWDPFSNGAWTYYAGAGYSWVSPYPWGWTPYHYGSWSFCPGAGWGWMPGGSWNGLGNNLAVAGNAPPIRIQPPNHPPRLGEPTFATVSLKPLVRSEVASRDSFVFRNDSAGLGIPRAELGKLDKFSRQAVDRGTASTHIYMNAPSLDSGRTMAGTMAPVPIHRGSVPEAATHEDLERVGASSGSIGGASQSSSASSSRPVSAPSGHPH